MPSSATTLLQVGDLVDTGMEGGLSTWQAAAPAQQCSASSGWFRADDWVALTDIVNQNFQAVLDVRAHPDRYMLLSTKGICAARCTCGMRATASWFRMFPAKSICSLPCAVHTQAGSQAAPSHPMDIDGGDAALPETPAASGPSLAPAAPGPSGGGGGGGLPGILPGSFLQSLMADVGVDGGSAEGADTEAAMSGTVSSPDVALQAPPELGAQLQCLISCALQRWLSGAKWVVRSGLANRCQRPMSCSAG